MKSKKIKTTTRTVFLFVTLLCSVMLSTVVAAEERVRSTPVYTTVSVQQPEKITFPSTDSDLCNEKPTMLDGYLFRPEGKGPFPAIVGLHGCSGLLTHRGKLTRNVLGWGQRLAGLGYVVVFPDSFNPRGASEVCTRKDRAGFAPEKERTKDTYGALLWLQSQPFVRKDRIGLMGWSHGGSTLLAAIYAPLPQAAASDFRVAIAFYPGCTRSARNYNWQPRAPLTILIGNEDDWTPAPPCQSLIERSKSRGLKADIVVFPDAHHGFDAPDSPIKTRTVANNGRSDGIVTVGTNPKARVAVLELVPTILEQYLRDPKGSATNITR